MRALCHLSSCTIMHHLKITITYCHMCCLSLTICNHFFLDLSYRSSAPNNNRVLSKEGKYEIVIASAGKDDHPTRTPNYLPSPSLLRSWPSNIVAATATKPQTIQSQSDTIGETGNKRPASISSVVKSVVLLDNRTFNNPNQRQDSYPTTTSTGKIRTNRSILTTGDRWPAKYPPSNVTTYGAHSPNRLSPTNELVELLKNPFYSRNLIHYYISYLLCTSSLLLILYRFCGTSSSKNRFDSKLSERDRRHNGTTKQQSNKQFHGKIHASKLDPNSCLGPGESRSCHRCQSKLGRYP